MVELLQSGVKPPIIVFVNQKKVSMTVRCFVLADSAFILCVRVCPPA